MRDKLEVLAVIAVFFCLALLVVFTLSCTDTQTAGDPAVENRQTSTEQRALNFERARLKYPQPIQENFPMREALVKYTERQDLLNHPWYIYVANECFQCPTGLAYVYFIGQTYPQSTCNFLGSTEEVQKFSDDGGEDAWLKFQAPSLDGIFYGSGATTGGCDYFFFDIATDAMQVIHHNWQWFVSDRPLLIDARLMTAR